MHHPVANFLYSRPTVYRQYVCQKLWKIIENRQSYCNESRVQFFWPTVYLNTATDTATHFNRPLACSGRPADRLTGDNDHDDGDAERRTTHTPPSHAVCQGIYHWQLSTVTWRDDWRPPSWLWQMKTRSSATAEKQRVSYTRLPGLVSWPSDDHTCRYNAQNTTESRRLHYFYSASA